ncbi:hypothetical protein ACFQ3N_19655 [Virgibacillus byunsanensis]|uniref:Uncharacterized protein n=1 Tax=Virgibacillus byunsanensis TaxID=570945 RepID=A0ABW3LSD7_9BACI
MVCLIIIVPILSVPINLGKYDNDIAELTAKFNGNLKFLFLFLTSLFYILGPITNLGSIHIINSMVQKLRLPPEFLGRVYVRGFSSINTWAPYFASVFLVVYYLEIPMAKFLPYGLLLSFFQFLTANTLFSLKEARSISIEYSGLRSENGLKKLYELFFILLLLIGVIFYFEPYIDVNVSILIILASVIFSIVWSMYLKKFKRFMHKTQDFRDSIMPKQANEISLFLSAGFFGVVLSTTIFSDYLNIIWIQVAGVSILLLISFTISLVAILSFLGIHQIVIISSILASVSPSLIGIDDITLAMILLSSWAIAGTVSPITPTNVVTSDIINVNVYQIILKWNLLYSIILAVVHTLIIYIVHLLI